MYNEATDDMSECINETYMNMTYILYSEYSFLTNTKC